MRISNLQMQRRAVDAILEQQSKLSKTQLQIATGRRILTPADDPSGAQQVLSLQEVLATNNQFSRNSTVATNRLRLEESVLTNVTNLLHAVRERTVQAANGTLSDADRGFIAREVEAKFDELLELANIRDSNGEYIFGGSRTLTKPFGAGTDNQVVYSGDQGQRELLIGPDYRVAVGDHGDEVFLRVDEGNGVFVVRDGTSNTGAGVADPGTVVDPSAYDGEDYTIVMAAATAATGGLTLVNPSANTIGYQLSINGVTVHSEADASAPSVTDLDGLATAINDDTPATGVSAMVDNGSLYLVNDPVASAGISVQETATGGPVGPADNLTTFFGSVLDDGTSSLTIDIPAEASGYLVSRDATGAMVASGAYVAGGDIAFSGIKTGVKGSTNLGDSFNVAPSGKQDVFATLNSLIGALESGTPTVADGARFQNAVNRSLTDLDQVLEHILDVRSRVGSRLQAIDSEEQVTQDLTLFVEGSLSEIQDLDYASATSEFQLQLVALQAAQQAFARIQGLSLFNFL